MFGREVDKEKATRGVKKRAVHDNSAWGKMLNNVQDIFDPKGVMRVLAPHDDMVQFRECFRVRYKYFLVLKDNVCGCNGLPPWFTTGSADSSKRPSVPMELKVCKAAYVTSLI